MKPRSSCRTRAHNQLLAAISAFGLISFIGPVDGANAQLFKRAAKTHGRAPVHRHGYQGFGLNYHLGYGYGGDAVGTGPAGGYPFHGGPGYPHAAPGLNRHLAINPFPYQGSPGYPTSAMPNAFGMVGPLAPDDPVVTIHPDPSDPYSNAGDYGSYTGTVPYAESTFAPHVSTTIAPADDHPIPPSIPGDDDGAAGTTHPLKEMTPATDDPNPIPDDLKALGIDAKPVLERDSKKVAGLKISRVFQGGVAQKAGLQPGDVIRSINGYLTREPNDIVWILAKATPADVLTISLHQGKEKVPRNVSVPLR